ncbi:nuclear transport factor 2 family protein [Gordonia rubripertincta]|uniref:Nuclear transport factor 2 family protein n=1 Tax=Gordonia rubripertincta TaxID=36822 RepID=A0ABT4MVL8_GORRU|nr:limonene-1,2-epoxide hydrolase family protein [Gordonia rubripertincta]MCZ4551054.1 nuclear transport factor 2 family protein [Gordonia rubripertincta]
MVNKEAIVRDLFGMWGDGIESCKQSWIKYADENIVWWNSGRGSVEGMAANLSAMDQMGSALGISRLEVTIKNILAGDEIVFVERLEDYYRADGTHIKQVPVAGVFTFRDGKLVELRDYCVDWLTDYVAELQK